MRVEAGLRLRPAAVMAAISLLAAPALADDQVCRDLAESWPASGAPPYGSAQRWSNEVLDELLEAAVIPPLSEAAKRTLRDEFTDSIQSHGYALEIGRTAAGSIGVFESMGGSAACALGYVLTERNGSLELTAEIGTDISPCNWASIRLLEVKGAAVPVIADEARPTDGQKSHASYDVLTYQGASSWAAVACSVQAVYNDSLGIEWNTTNAGTQFGDLRGTLEPIVLAAMRAGNEQDAAEALAALPSAPSDSPAAARLRAMLGPENTWPEDAEGPEWLTVPEENRPPRFDAVARFGHVGDAPLVVAVGRYWGKGGIESNVPLFQVLGWNGKGYILLAHGAAIVQSTFNHVEVFAGSTTQ